LSFIDFSYGCAAAFDLELYDPSGNLVDSSRTNDPIGESIGRNPMGTSGFWVIRICGPNDGQAGNGVYGFRIWDYEETKYVLSVAGYGVLSYGGALNNPDGMIGASPNANSSNDCAGVASYYPTGAAYICGYLNADVSGGSYIYFYGDGASGYTNTLRVYVSTDNQNWQQVSIQTIAGNGALSTRYVGYTTLSYRYIIFCHYGSVGCVFIDNVSIET